METAGIFSSENTSATEFAGARVAVQFSSVVRFLAINMATMARLVLALNISRRLADSCISLYIYIFYINTWTVFNLICAQEKSIDFSS